MKMPNKIYVREYPDVVAHFWEEKKKDLVATIPHEYIHKDCVDEMLKTAEDHAYFAGQEKFREKLMEWVSNMLGQVSDMGFDDVDVEYGYTRALQDVIKHLNSM